MSVIDVHTHMLDREWLRLLKEKGAPRYDVGPITEDLEGIYADGALFMTPMPGHFDYDLRIRDMDDAGVDLAIVSLTCPNVYWGGEAVSLEAARIMNDSMADGQSRYPERIRWLASLPWEHPTRAVAELARACDAGAVGVMVLANVAGRQLTEPAFQPIWQAIDERALPVLVHPTEPPGTPAMDMRAYSLASTVGFMFDTTLAITRMVFDGFLDRYPNLKIIAAHVGATVPYLAGRMDRSWEMTVPGKDGISEPPSACLRRIYYDAVTYQQEALELCIAVGGEDKVMYGSDYPHDIGDMKGCLSRVDALPAGQREKVRGTNARKLFNI
ncbi:MAG: amidohydrolase family protein [Alphaproteobacteria bacterium]|jgi:aminocarboxymuconate-semialdehyde decarboxylase|nr:amidohydrolase family protein [Alphaproteobacteria bacterium]